MNNNKKTLKSIVFSMVLAAGMLLSASGFAQERGDGLFGLGDLFKGDSFEADEWLLANEPNELGDGLFQRGGNRSGGSIFGHEAFGAAGSEVGNEAFGAAGSQIDNEAFGAPIGGGLGILLAAGAGYALIQSKKNK